MNPIARYILMCLLPLSLARLASAQSSFSMFEDVKPKGKIDSVIIKSESAYDRTYVYNKSGQLTDCIYVMKDMPKDTMKFQYTYGKNRHLLSSVKIFKGKRDEVRYAYLPQKSGYTFRVVDSAAKSDTSIIYEMRYNKLGQLIQWGYYHLNNPDHQLAGNWEYKYDIKGNIIEQINYYNDKQATKRLYKYDNEGNITMITKGKRTDPWYLIFYYSDYDKMHNWTVQTSQTQSDYELGSGSKLSRRITYYK